MRTQSIKYRNLKNGLESTLYFLDNYHLQSSDFYGSGGVCYRELSSFEPY